MEGNKRVYMFAGIAIVCVIILGLAVYFQFFFSNASKKIIFGGSNNDTPSDEVKYDNLKTAFYSSFNNSVRRINNEMVDIEKVDATKDVVYTKYNIDIYADERYDINVNIPYINLAGDIVDNINKEIDNLFGSKVNDVVKSRESLSTYNIDYVAFINGDIISLVIKATLKELDYPQRLIVKTYNYDVAKKREVPLESLINSARLSKEQMQEKIYNEIRKEIKQNEALAQAGYQLYTRKIEDEMYKIENTKTFCIDQNDYIYIIYAYGNSNFTSEMDLIIF
jgi:hypothetical protein